MIKKSINWSLAAMSLLMWGCSSDEGLVSPDSAQAEQTINYRIPLEEALSAADAMMGEVEQSSTRSHRKVSSVSYKTTQPSTRSASTDTLLYLVNYGDNEGFALLSADRRLPSIYAISDEGHMEFSDTITNPALGFYMQMVDQGINSRLSSQGNGWVVVPPVQDYYKQFEGRYVVIKPKLTKTMTELTQKAPYNKYCFIGNKKFVAGCAPVAFTMWLSFYKYPTYLEGYSFPWSEMNSGANTEAICRFIQAIRGEKYLNVITKSTDPDRINGVDPSSYLPALNNLGFDVQNGFEAFNEQKVWSVLSKAWDIPVGAPVFVRGNELEGGGHAWVIDGGLKKKPVSDDLICPGLNPVYPEGPDYLFHCVWGWGGYNNGFFRLDANTLGGNPDELGEIDDNGMTGTPFIFHNLQFIGNIKQRNN